MRPTPLQFAILLALPACKINGETVVETPVAAPGQTVAVAWLDLGTKNQLMIAAETELHAASTMKIPILIELYRRADAGEIDLDAEIRVRNEFASIVDGSAYTLDPAEDSDHGLYEHTGETMSYRELGHRMITRSSNLATNLLIGELGAAAVQRTCIALGAPGMKVLRGVEDTKAYRRGLSNTTTAKSLATLLAAIAEGRAASRESCAEIVEILAAQEFDEMIPAGLPDGTKIAHKTGWITGIRHDAAIVYPQGRGPYVLVILTEGFEDPEEADEAGAKVAAMVHAVAVQTQR